MLGEASRKLGIAVDYITDVPNLPIFRAVKIEPMVGVAGYLDDVRPTHLVSIERLGRGEESSPSRSKRCHRRVLLVSIRKWEAPDNDVRKRWVRVLKGQQKTARFFVA